MQKFTMEDLRQKLEDKRREIEDPTIVTFEELFAKKTDIQN